MFKKALVTLTLAGMSCPNFGMTESISAVRPEARPTMVVYQNTDEAFEDRVWMTQDQLGHIRVYERFDNGAYTASGQLSVTDYPLKSIVEQTEQGTELTFEYNRFVINKNGDVTDTVREQIVIDDTGIRLNGAQTLGMRSFQESTDTGT